MRRLGRTLSVSVEGLFPFVDGAPGSEANKQSAAKVEKARAVVTSVGKRLAAITAPKPVRPDHRRLIKAVETLGIELDMLTHKLQKGDSKPLGTYLRLQGLQTVAKVVADIKQKGYAIG